MKIVSNLLWIVMAFAFVILTGCGRDSFYINNVSAPATSEPVSDSIQRIVDDENDYRLSLGQTMLSRGLTCTVQKIASGQWLSNSSPGYQANQGVLSLTGTNYSFLNSGGFNQSEKATNNVFNVLPSAIQPLFVNSNFKLNCTGFIVIEEDGYHNFSLSSDDGSILTVDGTQIINNDGSHGVVTKTGTKSIRRGVRSFTLSYAQSGLGNFALVLNMNGAIAPGAIFYH